MSAREQDVGEVGRHHPVAGDEIYIPFGHFTSGGVDHDSGHELLIGRLGLRSTLIRQLVFGGKQLACLVTGRRGMGKTSFVRYCLQEYEQNYFERFRRGEAGKNLIDWAVLLLVLILISLLGVLMARVSSLLIMSGLFNADQIALYARM